MLDVAIIGGGVIGLSTAYELTRRGASVHVLAARRAGTASEAAAGLLAPSMGVLSDEMRPFFTMSLEAYPAFVEALRTFDPELAIVAGLIEVTTEAEQSAALANGARFLTAADVAHLEPNISAPHGAVFHARDGATDNERLVRALRMAVDATPSATRANDDVVRIELADSHATLVTKTGARVEAAAVVLAAGAWAAQIEGLPRRLPVAPLKGQMLAVESTALRHPIAGDDVYLVPRAAEIVIGATAEHAGFDLTVDLVAVQRLRQAAIRLCPGLAAAPVLRTWAGIRPATPDLFPILGADPAAPRLIYACGHSKNGILLAPATAIATAALALGDTPIPELTPFSIARFDANSPTPDR